MTKLPKKVPASFTGGMANLFTQNNSFICFYVSSNLEAVSSLVLTNHMSHTKHVVSSVKWNQEDPCSTGYMSRKDTLKPILNCPIASPVPQQRSMFPINLLNTSTKESLHGNNRQVMQERSAPAQIYPPPKVPLSAVVLHRYGDLRVKVSLILERPNTALSLWCSRKSGSTQTSTHTGRD